MPENTLFEVAGLLGVLLYIGSYAALQTGFIRGHGYLYASINLAAASCVMISLAGAFNLSSALIQGAWIIISIVGITRIFLLHRRMHFSTDEADFLQKALPALPRDRGRALLDQGFWLNAAAGTVLTRENVAISHLYYLADGEASVEAGGATIASIKPNNFIGEITYLTGAPANGTVSLTKPSFYFAIEAKKLRRFLKANADIASVLEMSMAGKLRDKLVARNQFGGTSAK